MVFLNDFLDKSTELQKNCTRDFVIYSIYKRMYVFTSTHTKVLDSSKPSKVPILEGLM